MMNNMGNMMQMVGMLKQNPLSFLGNYNVPQNMVQDPQAIIQHMMNNGAISQAQYDAAIRQARSLGINI